MVGKSNGLTIQKPGKKVNVQNKGVRYLNAHCILICKYFLLLNKIELFEKSKKKTIVESNLKPV